MKTAKKAELSAESQAFFDNVAKDFQINDPGGLKILFQAAQCLDRVSEARTILDKEGMVIYDRFTQARPHPAAKLECDFRAGFLASMRLLGLDGAEGVKNA
jgi:hypothetical protein